MADKRFPDVHVFLDAQGGEYYLYRTWEITRKNGQYVPACGATEGQRGPGCPSLGRALSYIDDVISGRHTRRGQVLQSIDAPFWDDNTPLPAGRSVALIEALLDAQEEIARLKETIAENERLNDEEWDASK